MLRASLASVRRNGSSPTIMMPFSSSSSSSATPSAILVRHLSAAAAAAAETQPRPQSTIRQTTFAIIHGAGGKPLHNREILAALQASMPPASPEKERLTLTYVKTKILRHLREKGSIRSVATFTEGKKRPEYGYVVNTLPKEYKTGKPQPPPLT